MDVIPVKTITAIVIVIISLVCLKLLIPATFYKCNFANTVNITAGHHFPNGSYEFENVIYNKGFYKNYNFILDKHRQKVIVEKHIRGCLCAIKSCIRICKNYENLEYINVYNQNDIEEKIYIKNNTDYHIMTHNPCYGYYFGHNDKYIFYKASVTI